MVIVFANNQAMTAIHGTASAITTDPVPLNGNDRASAMLNVHYIFGQASAILLVAFQGQVSNDGVNWVNVTALTEDSATVTTTPVQVVAAVNGAYLRFVFTFTVTGAGNNVGGVAFDLHVKLDHV